MIRTRLLESLILVFIVALCRPAPAQDMRLAEILIDGQGWELVGEGYAFTEGPAVDRHGTLYFTDVFRSKIYRLSAQGKPEVFVDQSYGTNGLEFGPDGLLYGCQNGKKRIVAYDASGHDKLIAEGFKNCNDLVVTRSGGVYFTDPEEHLVWYVPPGGEKRVVDEGIGFPNGLALWPDEGTLVVADMNTSHLWAFRVDADGNLKFHEPFYTMRLMSDRLDSGADGMTIDSVGRAYVTTRVGLQMFDPQGRLSGVIDKPQNAWLSNVTFGGPDFNTLYVTCTNKVYKRQVKASGVKPPQIGDAK